jgi:hypothetical protein
MEINEALFVLKEVVIPITTFVLGLVGVLGSLILAWRRGLFSANSINSSPPTIRRTGAVEPVSAILLDVEKFDEYHSQSLSQARISFWFSLIFASFGFFIICMSIFLYSGNTAILGIISGAVIDAVSALFFYQSNKARQLMSEFFDRLRVDRKLSESLKLCDAIDDSNMKNSLRVTLALYFAGLEQIHETAKGIVEIRAKSPNVPGAAKPDPLRTADSPTEHMAPELRVAT